eukprot:TRINITY_DN11463_c0_g1_i1.p2 TRINITY_DN11463_c0_g1~~TRINITY_DN11463_c0_g1_i1.p2  ORF type:complete len:171 (-),score=3.54 TRINITY_DN11463_c0_g1_i1:1023-1535(-)
MSYWTLRHRILAADYLVSAWLGPGDQVEAPIYGDASGSGKKKRSNRRQSTNTSDGMSAGSRYDLRTIFRQTDVPSSPSPSVSHRRASQQSPSGSSADAPPSSNPRSANSIRSPNPQPQVSRSSRETKTHARAQLPSADSAGSMYVRNTVADSPRTSAAPSRSSSPYGSSW